MSKIEFIKRELKDLDIQPGSEAYIYIFDQCVHAMDILSKSELSKLIEDHLESFRFDQRGF